MSFLDDETFEASQSSTAGRVWSPLQESIYSHTREKQDNLIINGVAGCGKTTTIIAAMEFAQGSSLFLAFNRDIATTIRGRLVAGEARTFNSLGDMLWKTFTSAKLEARKTSLWLDKAFGAEHPLVKEFGYQIQRLAGLAKNNGFGIKGTEFADLGAWGQQGFEDLIDAYQLDIPPEMSQNVAEMALKVFELSRCDTTCFDFDDQLYGPVYFGWRFPKFDNVFIDETQDLTEIQHLMIEALRAHGARIIAVGDRRQAIYGFRGALTDSMDRLKSRFGMIELPLSITYRCPQSVVKQAQRLCPEILARDGAPLGIVRGKDYRIAAPQGDPPVSLDVTEADPKLFPSDHMVICRNNAPLFRAILRHIRARSPCQVKTSFLDNFVAFVRKFRCRQTSKLLEKLDTWYEKETESAKSKGQRGRLAGIQDRYETIKLLCSLYQTVEEVISLVKELGEGSHGPVFSTIHRAKGLEALKIYILRPDLIPAFYAQGEEQLKQEDNLLYVAITRSASELTYGAIG